jgi:nicotinamidase-related amidase
MMIRPEHSALLLSEFQNGMTNAAMSDKPIAREATRRQIPERADELAAACRGAGIPVIFGTLVPRRDYQGFGTNCELSRHIRAEGRLREDDEYAAIHPALRPQPEDWWIVRRQGISDWSGSELDQILRNLGVTTLILAGVSTNVGIYATCIGAVERGFDVVLAEDCTAGAPQKHHERMVAHSFPLLCTVSSAAAMVAAWRATDPAGSARVRPLNAQL